MDQFLEDSWNDLLPLPGGRESVGGVLRGGVHKGRPHIQGATEGTGLMQGVQGVDGGGIPDKSSDDSTWEGGGDKTELENPGRRGRAAEFRMTFPAKGGQRRCPVEVCLGRVATRTVMRVHLNEDHNILIYIKNNIK